MRFSAAAGDAMALAMQEAAVPWVSEAEIYAAGLAAACRRGASASQISIRTGPGFAARRWTRLAGGGCTRWCTE